MPCRRGYWRGSGARPRSAASPSPRAASLFAAGECDFVEVAADLPVWTLAHVMGVPNQDRRLLYDWASRVIGYQDDEYAGLSTAGVEDLTPTGRLAVASRPRPRPGTNPRSRAALTDIFAYAHALAGSPANGESVMSAMLRGGLTGAEFENMFFLFAVAGNETLRNGIPGGLLTLLEHPAELARLRRDPSLLDSATTPPPTATRRSSPTPTGSTSPGPRTTTSASASARTSAWAPTSPGSRCARSSRNCSPGT